MLRGRSGSSNVTLLVLILEPVREFAEPVSLRRALENELRCEDPSDGRAVETIEVLSEDPRRHKRIVPVRFGGPWWKSFVGAVVMIDGVRVRESEVGTGGGFGSRALCPIAESEAWRKRIRLKRGVGFAVAA